jgi:hypothetical protein
MARSTPEWIPCRLCDARANFSNTKRLLGRHDVRYYLCSGCGSLQTEVPYWLDEAYDVTGLGDDLGAGQRTIELVLKTAALLDTLNLPVRAECIDFGGGLGLFTRLMRDRGFNFRSYDLYAQPFFSDRYSVRSMAGRSPAVVTAFEVLEHFTNPKEDLERLFESRPALVIATTELFAGQDETWPYLADGTGQHVFFYSAKAVAGIARRFRYSVSLVGGMLVFAGRPELAQLGLSADEVIAKLKILSQGNRLMRRALELFVKHQQAPYEHVLRDVEETRRG